MRRGLRKALWEVWTTGIESLKNDAVTVPVLLFSDEGYLESEIKFLVYCELSNSYTILGFSTLQNGCKYFALLAAKEIHLKMQWF